MTYNQFVALLLLSLTLNLFTSPLSWGDDAIVSRQGKIYYPKETHAFTYEWEKHAKGSSVTTITRYKDLAGKILVEEETQYEDGKLARYSYRQNQVDEQGSVEMKGNQALFSFTAQGKTEKDQEEIEPDMIVADMVPEYVKSKWKTLEKGESVKVRFMLPERQESIGFKFFFDGERTVQGKKAMDVIMKPSSFIIAALAPSLRFSFEKEEPHRLLESMGRLPIRVSEVPNPTKRRHWKAIDALMVIEEKK